MDEFGEHAPDPTYVDRLLAQDREKLIAIANAVLHDRDEAEDVVQQTIATVWQRFDKISSNKFDHYIARSIRRNALKRRMRRRRFIPLSSVEIPVDRSEKDSLGAGDPIDLEDAIQTLSLTQQEVIRMKYFLGLTFQQIGVSLSISANTAASRLRYAIAKLKHYFNG